jgi:hypothetical protein
VIPRAPQDRLHSIARGRRLPWLDDLLRCPSQIVGIVAACGVFVIGALSEKEEDTGEATTDVHVALANGASATIALEASPGMLTRVTMHQVLENPASTHDIKPVAGRRWVAFDVEIENVGTEETGALFWTIRDSSEEEFGQTFVDLEHELIPTGGIGPGGRMRGVIWFAIHQEASVVWLRAGPPVWPLRWLYRWLYFDAQ